MAQNSFYVFSVDKHALKSKLWTEVLTEIILGLLALFIQRFLSTFGGFLIFRKRVFFVYYLLKPENKFYASRCKISRLIKKLFCVIK